MGLYIYSKSSKKTYQRSYGGLHRLRWVAYKICGGDKDFGGFMLMFDGWFSEEYVKSEYIELGVKLPTGHYDWGYIVALQEFPNLMWHDDGDGIYTLRGRVAKFSEEPLTGNSKQLLKELRILRKKGKKFFTPRIEEIFKDLYKLVRDVVENGDGKIIFS